MNCRVVTLISGRGSNLQSLLDATLNGLLPIEHVGVLSNRPNAAGLERAARAGVTTGVVDHRQFNHRADFEAVLRARIDALQPDLVLLAGFMRILGAEFVQHYHGRMLNIHPSLLPAYRGLNTHQRALDDGVDEHGVSVHFVTAELDGGPIIAQARVPVLDGDNAEQLAARVLAQEHRLYPFVVDRFAQQCLHLDTQDRIHLDDQVLSAPLCFDQVPWP